MGCRDLWRSSGPTYLLKQSHLQHIDQTHDQMAFEDIQGLRLHNLPRQLVLGDSHSKMFFLVFRRNVCANCHRSCHKTVWPFLLYSFPSGFCTYGWHLSSAVSSELSCPISLALYFCRTCTCPLIILVAFGWISSSSSFSPLCWRAQNWKQYLRDPVLYPATHFLVQPKILLAFFAKRDTKLVNFLSTRSSR